MRSVRSRARYLSGFVTGLWLVVGVLTSTHAWAQSDESTPEEQYHRHISINENITPLGEDPFGEQVSLYTGELSFEQTDIVVHGNGPDIVIARSFSPGWRNTNGTAPNDGEFADWQLDLPRLTSMVNKNTGQIASYANFGGIWQVGISTPTDARCTQMAMNPPLYQTDSTSRLPVSATTWFHGYQLSVPGQGSQNVLIRANGQLSPTMNGPSGTPMTFNAFTNTQWMVGCLPNTASGEPGEAFWVVAPDGTKYWLNWFRYEWGPNQSYTAPIPPGGRPIILAAETAFAQALVTRVEDRFGNAVTYTYNSLNELTAINGSDGRSVSVVWRGDGVPYIDHITVTGSAGGSRTWTYQYAGVVPAPFYAGGYVGALSAVTLPDSSSWQFNLGTLHAAIVGTDPEAGQAYCNGGYFDASFAGTVYSGSITHPSGLTGTFSVTPKEHVRVGDVQPDPNACSGQTVFIPSVYWVTSLISKSYSGAGVSESWSYAYSNPPMTWAAQCPNGVCPINTTSTDVTNPDGSITRYSFNDTFNGAIEGKLVNTFYGFNPSTSGYQRLEQRTYADPTSGGPFNNPIGSVTDTMQNPVQGGDLAPVSTIQTIQDGGDTYTWQAQAFNAFAQPTQVARYSSIAGQTAITERTTYLNDTTHWVIGLPQEVDNLTTGETESTNTYNLSNITLQSRARFGQTLMSYTYDGSGQLSGFTDGNNHTTSLSNYRFGIPQTVGFPDGTGESLVVDDLGQISEITDQAGFTTGYQYDGIGRVSQVNFPTGDTVAWAPKVIIYQPVGTERGISGTHWRRTVTQGDEAQVSYFDALLRPVLNDTYRISDNGLHISARTDYDWKGNKTFVSFPVSGAPDLGAIGAGTSTTYDVLNRATQSQEPSELGTLTTTTAYLSGAREQVTDPNGNVTVSSYQVFDKPSYSSVIQVQAPQSVTQTISRDLYGNPQSITQGGGVDVPITKGLVYDAFHRLCRTDEPESGSAVMSYDGANNVAWTASGQTIAGPAFGPGATCGQEQVAAAAMTQNGYDAMNRVTSVVYPVGTDSATFTYDKLGKPATATSGLTSWTYGRNSLGLLQTETLSVDGFNWALTYGYDGNANLSSVLYPDGTSVAYAPDALGRATQVGGYASGVSYFPDGNLQSFTFGNGATYLGQENARNLLANFSYGTGSGLAIGEEFTYDGNANINKISDLTTGQRTKTLTYDGLNRLATATANALWGAESYSYDTLNNIRSITNSSGVLTYNYNGNNLLQTVTNGAITAQSYQYDPRGNVVNKNNVPLVFDQANRLLSITGYDDYLYDAAGRRVKSQANGSTTPIYYMYSQAGQLMYQHDMSTALETDFVYLGKKMIASNATVLPPAVPTLTAPAFAPTSGYTVTWRPVPGATNYTLQEYIIVKATQSGGVTGPIIFSDWTTTSSGDVTSWSTSHAVAGTHGYQVQACNTAGCSAWSSAAVVAVGIPSAPANIRLILTGSGSSAVYTVVWDAVPGATSYEVFSQGDPNDFNYKGSAPSYVASTGIKPLLLNTQLEACAAGGCSAPVDLNLEKCVPLVGCTYVVETE